MLKVVELFAGVGGFRKGLEVVKDTFDFVWMNQWEPGRKAQYAFNCYKTHFGENPSYTNEDISKVKHLIPPHNLLVGGFPCQDYSVARTNALGIQGKKGVLWWEINTILKEHRPEFVLLENVDRLLKSPASQRGRDFAVMLRCFFELGYFVEWRVINAADYGNAQRRRRVFIFATKKDAQWISDLPCSPESIIREKGFFGPKYEMESLHSLTNFCIDRGSYSDLLDISLKFTGDFHKAGYMLEGRIFSAEPFLGASVFSPLRDVLQHEQLPERYFIDDLAVWKYLKGAKRAPRVKPNGEEYFYTEGAIPFPDKLDFPARTMLTSEATKNRSTHIIEDPFSGRFRFLTPIECERLNGFPDDWTGTGMPERWRYFTMGNALVVPLISQMGERIKEIYKYGKKE